MWIDRAVKWLLPREEHFFDLLERGAARAREISALLVDCCAAGSHADREAIVERMHQVEHEADRVIAEVYEALNRTFVTPLDRSDIYSLAVSLEEVADAVFATALQFVVHAMEDLPGGSCELAALILQSCEAIQAAVTDLRGMKDAGRHPRAVRAARPPGERGGPDLPHAARRDVPDRDRRHPADQAQGVPRRAGADARRLRGRGRRPADRRHQERLRPAVNTALLILVLVVVAALAFDYINGFHDAANAVATVVSTGVLPLRTAILLAALLNFAGALTGTAVAATIGKGLVEPGAVTQVVVLSALLGAILWNLVTWYFGIPSSSSHALVGGLVGSALAHAGGRVDPVRRADQGGREPGRQPARRVRDRLRADDRSSSGPAGGGSPSRLSRTFRRLQIVSAGFMALSHGSNDAQKTMGIIAMSLAVYSGGSQAAGHFHVPLWVMVACAAAMGAGTMAGGVRIIKTMGTKIIDLKPVHGFAAETSAAVTILAASHLGLPVSTTHVISGAIMGVGLEPAGLGGAVGGDGADRLGLGADHPDQRGGGLGLLPAARLVARALRDRSASPKRYRAMSRGCSVFGPL